MFVIYSNTDEAIICTPETEPETFKLWFTEGGRDLEDYDRETSEEAAIAITSKIEIELG